ncbi:MAG: insulinase family protein [Firmicutes bacterium]|nr:insulinase family protein [Bacillota bacterium]
MAEKYVLSNGVRLLLEYMPHLRSVSAGVWADTGSARETEAAWGVSHLLEHMLFKGTPTRTSLQLSAAMDDVGGVLNAFTSKEQTCYYTKALDEDLELSLDLLSDMYARSLLDANELERERGVVIEEINMYEDSPDELVLDLFSSAIWPDHSYGRSISGTVESVSALDRQTLYDYWLSRYTAEDTVLALAGNVCPERAKELAEKYFGALRQGDGPFPEPETPAFSAGQAFIEKDIEQNHICMGFPGVSLRDDDYYAAAIVSNLFGGSASARLFQEIREKRGLAYSAFSHLDCFKLGGSFFAYASTQPEKTNELVQVMADEFARLAVEGLAASDIERSKRQLKGSMLLGLESTSSTMNKLGKMELSLGRVYSPEETVEKLMAVTPDDVMRVIRRMVRPGALVLAQVGPTDCGFTAKELF